MDHVDGGILDELVAAVRSRRTVVFVGAGISLHSGLPLASQLVERILSRFELRDPDRALLGQSGLPLEVLFDSLVRNSHADALFSLFEAGEPCTTHLLLAKLVTAGFVRTVITTNFDTLLERALDSEGWAAGRDYEVLSTDAQFSGGALDTPGPLLIKLHGCASNHDSMAMAVGKVARKEGVAAREGVVRAIFMDASHDCVLILGYSCSDIFDISPAIESIRGSGKRIFLVEHSSIQKVESIAFHAGSNPFRGFGPDSRRIYHDTDAVVEHLWRRLLPELEYAFHAVPPCWERYVESWAADNASIAAFGVYIPSILLSHLGRFDLAIRYAERAVDLFRSAGALREEGLSLTRLGVGCHSLARYDEAITHFEAAIHRLHLIGDENGVAYALNHLGNTHSQKGDHVRAEECYRQALALDQSPSARLVTLNHLSASRRALGDFGTAASHATQVLELARELGDKQAESAALGNLATTYRNQRQHALALECIRQPLEIARMLKDRRSEGIGLSNMANVLWNMGEAAEAVEAITAALEIAREIGDTRAVEHRTGTLAVFQAHHGDEDPPLRGDPA